MFKFIYMFIIIGQFCTLNNAHAVMSAVGKIGAMAIEAGLVTIPGGEGVNMIFKYAFDSYNEHKEAMSKNKEFIQLVDKRFAEVGKIVRVLFIVYSIFSYMHISQPPFQ